MLPQVAGLGQHFQAWGHSFSLYWPPSRYIFIVCLSLQPLLWLLAFPTHTHRARVSGPYWEPLRLQDSLLCPLGKKICTEFAAGLPRAVLCSCSQPGYSEGKLTAPWTIQKWFFWLDDSNLTDSALTELLQRKGTVCGIEPLFSACIIKSRTQLPFLTSHLSPVQGCWQEQEKVCFSWSGKQEPPLRQLVIKHPWIELKTSRGWEMQIHYWTYLHYFFSVFFFLFFL